LIFLIKNASFETFEKNISTTVTAEPWEIFSTHFLTKKAHKCTKKYKNSKR
jgi:hypothetical protein